MMERTGQPGLKQNNSITKQTNRNTTFKEHYSMLPLQLPRQSPLSKRAANASDNPGKKKQRVTHFRPSRTNTQRWSTLTMKVVSLASGMPFSTITFRPLPGTPTVPQIMSGVGFINQFTYQWVQTLTNTARIECLFLVTQCKRMPQEGGTEA